VVISQGGSGGSGDAVAPPGELVSSLSTAFSDTWKAPKTGLVSRLFASPVNYKGSDGRWHAIDSALTPRALGGYENTANSFSLTLPESLSTGVSLSDEGRSVSFSLEGASSAFPSVSGNTATYAGVLPSTDLSYISETTGVQELATLASSAAPAELRYELSTSGGLSPERETDGSIALVDEQSHVWFTIPAPRAFPADSSSRVGRRLASSLEAVGSGWVLTVDTNESWLREDLASEAVVVDPSIESSASQACTLAAEAPTTSYCAASTLQLGYETGEGEHQALLKFPVTSLPLGALILNAKLGLFVQSDHTLMKPVGVYRVTKPWTTAATWDTYDGTHAWSTPGGDYANPEHNSDASVNSSVGGLGWTYWYPTRMVQEWVNTAIAPDHEGYANEGLIVKDQTDYQIPNLLTLASPSASSDKPYLEVSYEPRGFGSEPQYTQLSTPLTDKLTMSINPASGNLKLANEDMNIAGTDGMNFTAVKEFNNLDPEVHRYGRWSESLQIDGFAFSNGDVLIWDNGAAYPFAKQSTGSFATPPGLKAILCTAGHAPCPPSLPEKATWRLILDAPSGIYVDISASSDEPVDIGNKYGDTLTAGYTEGDSALTSWTDTGARKFKYAQKAYDAGAHAFYTELSDEAGKRHTSYTYGSESEAGGSQLRSYTDANNKTSEFEYEYYDLTKVTLPGGEVVKLKYNATSQVEEVIRTTNSGHTTGPTTKLIYFEAGKAPLPCTPEQKGTIIEDPDWTKTGEHEVLYCSNVLDEVEKTVDPNGTAESDRFEKGTEAIATYNPFADQISSSSASPGNSETGETFTGVYDEAGVNLLCQVATGVSGPETCERPNDEALVTSYAYLGGKTPYSATQKEDAGAHSISNCYSEEAQPEKHPEEPPCTVKAEPGAPAGSLAHETDQLPEQNTLSFTYETDGNVKTSTTADGETTEYKYDSQGQLEEIKPPAPLLATKITNDADGRPEVITNGAGHKTTVSYDKLDRETKIVYSGTGTEKIVKYTYEPNGYLTKREDPTGTTKYKLDKLDRLTKEELPSGTANEYAYDPASNLTAFTDSGGETEYHYNWLNELASMKEPAATKLTTFTYDGDHRLIKLTYPSGVSENYKLEASTGRPEKITAEGTSGLTVPTLSYSYKKGESDTALVQTLKETTPAGVATVTYSYDALNRLTEAVTLYSRYSYVLDGDGNRLQQTVNTSGDTGGETTYYGYNAADELECHQTVDEPCTGSKATEYSYDGGGELTSMPDFTFAYNAANELSAVTPTGASEEFLSYGGTGQDDLVSEGSTGLQSSLLGITKETLSAGTSYFARTPTGLLIDQRSPSSGGYNPLYDAQGDVIALVSSSGKVERTFHYGPYGENTTIVGTQAVAYPFGYKGGYRALRNSADEANNRPSGISHFGQRYYEPTIGRWTQQDPLKQPFNRTEANLYQGFGGDPINLSDPTGEPGEPAGAQCEYSSTYNHQHSSLCAEVEATSGEGLEAIDDVCEFADAVPIAGETCDAYSSVKYGVEIYEDVEE
jgi:RHS repeat-associated protein